MFLQSNSSCVYNTAPKTEDLLENMNFRQHIIYIFSICFLAFTFLFSCYSSYKIYQQYYGEPKLKFTKMIFIQNTYLVYSIISFTSLISPRSSVLGELIFSVYLSFTLKELMNVIISLAEDKSNFLDSSNQVSLASPPLACCFCCLCPSVSLNKIFKLVRIGILQAVLLRPLLNYIGAVIWLNGEADLGIVRFTIVITSESSHQLLIQYVNAASALIAMYFLALLFNGTMKKRDRYKLRIKYVSIQFVCLISSLQHSIMSLLSKKGLVSCDSVFNSQLRASDIHSFIVLGEMPILLIISSFGKIHLSQIDESLDEDEFNEILINI